MMTNTEIEIDKVQLRRAWSRLDQHFSEGSVDLIEGSDFDALEQLAEASGMPLLEGHFTPSLNTYTSENAFWLGLLDQEGRLVGRCTCRIDRIRAPMTLSDYWRKYFRRCYPSVEGGNVELAEKQPRFAQGITGNVAYIGGTHVLRGERRTGFGGYLNQMAQIVAMEKWEASFYYGWIQGDNFMDGFWRDCGFTQARHNAIKWKKLPSTLTRDLILVSNHAGDVCDMIDRIVDGSLSASSGSKEASRPSRLQTVQSAAQA